MKKSSYLYLIMFSSILIGFIIGRYEGFIINYGQMKNIDRLSQLITYLDKDYVDNIDTDSLVGQVIEDIIEELDPHSVYIPSKESQIISENMKGNFVGIGVSFFMIRDTIAVVRVLENGPSQKAGIKSGDRILMADRDTLFNKNIKSESIVSRLKGNSNSTVNLKVYRKFNDSIYNFKIVRASVALPSISAYYMIDDETGYIKINRFSQTTFNEFNKSIVSLVNQKMRNLILDLRGNPGGYLLPAKQIADAFLKSGKPIVIVESKNEKREKTISSNKSLFENGNLYILVDEQSASASEVVAGAIQDNDRGWILGRRTFGKGLVQQQMPLGKGDQIRLTTARYFTPTGRSIQRPYNDEKRQDYYAEPQNRFNTGEMKDKLKVPVVDSLVYKTPEGRLVYGGGGIMPDIYLSNENSIEEEWNDFMLRSNLVSRFVFLEMDKVRRKYNINNPARFYNDPLIDQDKFFKSFEKYCLENDFPLKINNRKMVINSIKAYIALQLFGENIFTRIMNQEDPFIQAALDHLNKN